MSSPEHQRKSTRFLDLLRPIEAELERYCRRMVFDQSDVPDVIQNAVLRAFRAFDRYHEGASFRAWMFKILTNEIFSLNRKRGRISKHEVPVEPAELEAFAGSADAADADAMLSWEELADALDEEIVAALQALNEVERAILLLR